MQSLQPSLRGQWRSAVAESLESPRCQEATQVESASVSTSQRKWRRRARRGVARSLLGDRARSAPLHRDSRPRRRPPERCERPPRTRATCGHGLLGRRCGHGLLGRGVALLVLGRRDRRPRRRQPPNKRCSGPRNRLAPSLCRHSPPRRRRAPCRWAPPECASPQRRGSPPRGRDERDPSASDAGALRCRAAPTLLRSRAPRPRRRHRPCLS